MKARWQALAAKFAALQQREKMLTAVAVVFIIGFGGYSVWVEPAMLRGVALKKQIAQSKTEMQNFQAQIVGLKSQLKDPDAPNRLALTGLSSELAATDQALHQYDKALVPPAKMPQLLQSLFVHHRGLELLSLQTLAPAPLLAPSGAKSETKTADAKPATPAAKGAGLQKHGIEIKMAGNYLDLLGYVDELERLPQKLLWGRMTLAVTGYPRSELTLTVYTLSLEETWMVV